MNFPVEVWVNRFGCARHLSSAQDYTCSCRIFFIEKGEKFQPGRYDEFITYIRDENEYEKAFRKVLENA